jgi:hypothetical protein
MSNNLLKKIFKLILVLVVATFCMSSEACQDDFFFADRAKVGASPSASADPSDSASPLPSASDTETPEVSPVTSAVASPSLAASVAASPAASTTSIESNRFANPEVRSLMTSLEEVAERSRKLVASKSVSGGGSGSKSNWLGKAYEDKEVAGIGVDTDGDGYTDALENDFGSDAEDQNSIPAAPVTSLKLRMQGVDDDVDGLSNQDESKRNANPNSADSDEDGYSDGAEVLSESDPLNSSSVPLDTDGDGLSDAYEKSIGSNPSNPDTDFDNLRDDLELAIGTDLHTNDFDSDGIIDGREVFLGSDPTLPEWK